MPEVSVQINLTFKNSTIGINTQFIYDSLPIDPIGKYKKIKDLKGTGSETSYKLNDSMVFIDNNICINAKEGRAYKLEIHYINIATTHPDIVESMLFLLRRNNCKVFALQYLKKCIKNKIDLKLLLEFFSVISRSYKVAALEKKKRRSLAMSKDSEPRKSSFNSESDFKIDEGMTLLLQSDVFSLIFLPLFEENTVNLNYLASCVQVYIKSLIEQDIQVQSNVQLLLAKIMTKTGRFSELQQFLQYRIIADSNEMIGFLLGIRKMHKNAFFLAVDMMHRMKNQDRTIDTLIENNFLFEAIKALELKNFSRVDILKIITKYQHEEDEQFIMMIGQIIKGWASLN